MKHFFRNNKGETLAETIIALSILAVGITVASSVMINSMRNLSNAKNRVTAVNIAREGIEAMRNIRDSNWLYYSDRRRQCWNHNPSLGTCENSNELIDPGYYVIYKKDDGSWQLTAADSDPANDSDGDGITYNDLDANLTRLSLVDISAALDSNSDGDSENDTDMYNHSNGTSSPLGIEISSTPFLRSVFIEYLDNNGNAYTHPDAIWTALPISTKNTLNRMRVTSTVEWVHGASYTAELTTIITDYLGRENLSN